MKAILLKLFLLVIVCIIVAFILFKLSLLLEQVMVYYNSPEYKEMMAEYYKYVPVIF